LSFKYSNTCRGIYFFKVLLNTFLRFTIISGGLRLNVATLRRFEFRPFFHFRTL
jgi:hypothetical protein